MSARFQAVFLALCITGSACAGDLMDRVFMPLADPLSTLPPVIVDGATLPGDTTVHSCVAVAEASGALTLAAAVDLALCRNPQIAGAWAGIRVQAAGLGQAKAAYLPTVSASAGRQHSRTSLWGAVSGASTLSSNLVSLTLGWRLFDFGGRAAATRSAQALLDAALASHDASLQAVLAAVVQSYFDAQTAQAASQSRQRQEAMAGALLETVARREQRGAAARTDTLQAATALARASLERSRADGAWRKSLAALVAVMGMPGATRLALADDLADPDDAVRGELDSWLAESQARHPALQAARAQLASAQENIDTARAEGLPTLDFNTAHYRNGRPNQGATRNTQETVAGVTLTIPLFDGFSHTYKVRGAVAQAERKEADLRELEHQVAMDVAKAHADASAALANLSASKRLLDAAEQARNSVQRRYERDAADVRDLLGTQSSVDDAQQERLRSLADWRSARLRLLAVAGRMGRWALEK